MKIEMKTYWKPSFLILFTLAFARTGFAQTCEDLIDQIHVIPDVIQIRSIHACGSEFKKTKGRKLKEPDACLMRFDLQGHRGPIPVMAYLDRANGISVPHIIKHDGRASGWKYSGRHFGKRINVKCGRWTGELEAIG